MNAKNMPVKLPDTLSALLRLAVADARKVAKLPGYRLEMWSWHFPEKVRGRQVCSVCMAGAVIANTLQTPRDLECGPGQFEQTNHLEAINAMRTGSFLSAARQLYKSEPTVFEAFQLGRAAKVVEDGYNDTGRAPWRVYLQAAQLLEDAGL